MSRGLFKPNGPPMGAIGGAKIVNFCLHGPSPAGFGRKGSGSPVLPPVPPPMAKSLGVTISARFCVLGGQNEDKRSNRLNLLVVSAISGAALEPKVRWGRRLDRRDEAVAQFEDPVHIRRRTTGRSAKSRPPTFAQHHMHILHPRADHPRSSGTMARHR